MEHVERTEAENEAVAEESRDTAPATSAETPQAKPKRPVPRWAARSALGLVLTLLSVVAAETALRVTLYVDFAATEDDWSAYRKDWVHRS